MSGYFSFSWIDPARTDFRFWFLFKTAGSVDPQELSDNVEQSVQRIPYPDVIAVLCHPADKLALEQALRNEEPCIRAISRLSTRTRLLVITYDLAGRLHTVSVAHSAGMAADRQEKPSLKRSFETIKQAGLAQLFCEEDVVIKAPGSFRFRKPSSGFSTHFIRAEEALDRSENVEFIAFCLLSRVERSSGWKDKALDTIFVDSMAISSIAFVLRERLAEHLGKSVRIESFHSHEGLKALQAPVAGHSFCLISASSSMSLERDWLTKTRCGPADVVTLLTFEGAKGAARALFVLPRPKEWSTATPETEGLRTLQILGERFQPEQLPARVVNLIRSHKCPNANELAKKFHAQGLIEIWKHDQKSTDRAFFVNGAVLQKAESFKQWLQKSLTEQFPRVGTIVFQQDDDSKVLAEECRYILSNSRNTSITLMSEDDAANHQWENVPVLVVACTVSRGAKFSTIAQSLRPCKAQKVFLIGLQVSRTAKDVEMLRSALGTQHGVKNLVLIFQSVCIGTGLKTSLEREKKLLVGFGEQLPARLKERRDWLNRIKPLAAEQVLLSHSVSRPLELRDDFQFWDAQSYTPGTSHAPLVLLSVAAALQNSRTDETTVRSKTLFSDALEQVVLGPATFERYNDGVVQAAILRNAYDAELDYTTLEASADMTKSISEMIRVRVRPQGEALAEFLLALATRRMKLRSDHLAELRGQWLAILQKGTADDHLSALLLDAATTLR